MEKIRKNIAIRIIISRISTVVGRVFTFLKFNPYIGLILLSFGGFIQVFACYFKKKVYIK